MARPFFNVAGPSQIFRVPNITPKVYRPGRQPHSPGESQIDSGNPHFNQIPWPNSVPSLIALANHPGTPRNRALQISNNSTASAPNNYLFLKGFAGKSRG